MKYISFFLAFALLTGCSSPDNATPNPSEYFAHTDTSVQTGGSKLISVQTPKGNFSVWTKRFGSNPRMRILLLHGGPGGSHEFFEAFESFLPAAGIEFIYYDQLGSLRSDKPTDSSLWTTERFVEEVEQVRQALGLNKNNFYLLGHSWGGILATEYALKYQQHLKGLIISNMMSSCPQYGRYADEVLAKQMPPAVLDSIVKIEKAKDFSNPRYMELLIPNFYHQHLCRVLPWPEPVNRAFAHINNNVYVLMQGPSEFRISGRLENWDRSKDLPRLTIPTLTIGGLHDTMDPEHMKWMATQVQQGDSLICPNGSHCSMWDDQAHYFPGLIRFVQSVDNGSFKGLKRK